MIELLLKNNYFQFVLAVATILGGISAIIHIGSLLTSHGRDLLSHTLRMFRWVTTASVLAVTVIAAIGMSHIFGTTNFALGALGFAFCTTFYLVPTMIRNHAQARDWLLVAALALLSVPLFLVCSFALFSASYLVFFDPMAPLVQGQPGLWVGFSVLEMLLLAGTYQVFRAEFSTRSFRRAQ